MNGGLQAIYGLGAATVLVWMVSRLVRAPRDVPLWAVTGLIACWAAGYPFGAAADAEAGFLGLAPMTCRLVQRILLEAGANCMVCFFLFSALEPRRARRRAAWYALPLVAVVAVQTAAALATPAGTDTLDVSVTSVLVLLLAAYLYMGFAFATAWVWTRRYARRAEPRLARGLRITSFGEAAIVASQILFVPVALLNWAFGEGDAQPSFDLANPAMVLGLVSAVFLLLPGVLLILVGISYQSVAMRLVALRVWWQHLRAYHRLRPLWTVLHRHFPEDTLHRVPTGRWRDVVSLRGVHRRYYRRVIECRDGLVHISPYLAAVRGAGGNAADGNATDGNGAAGGKGDAGTGGAEPLTAAVLAVQLGEALRAHAAGTPVSTTAMPIGVPAEGNLDADARELVALSRALRTAQPGAR